MLDHKLTIFYHTAKHLNTTKAAEILRLSQPAISKSIKELEKGLGITLFWSWERAVDAYPCRKIPFGTKRRTDWTGTHHHLQPAAHEKEFSGTLHIGASTTLSQYILPEYLARFRETHPYIEINLISGNTYQIEQELLDKNIQLAFIEGVPSQTDIHYIPFLKDEIVLVTSAKNDSPESITKEQLKTLKFVVREEGSGTYNIIQRQLSAAGMSINELNQQIVIGSTGNQTIPQTLRLLRLGLRVFHPRRIVLWPAKNHRHRRPRNLPHALCHSQAGHHWPLRRITPEILRIPESKVETMIDNLGIYWIYLIFSLPYC